MATPPAGRQPPRSPDRRDGSRPPFGGDLADRAPADDGARLAPREQAAIDAAVVRLERRGRGLSLVAALVAVAFVVGVLRPWDLVTSPGTVPATVPLGERAPVTVQATARPAASSVADTTAADAAAAAGPVAVQPTCGYPSDWRTATIQDWAGATARVWTATDAVRASEPADPAIPFTRVGPVMVEAIGWCAPVRGPERPPLAAIGTMYRVRDGVASEIPFRRLEPAMPDALGELWLPISHSPGRHEAWAEGRYVIRLAAPSREYVRFIGLEVGLPPRPAGTPAPSVAPRPPSATPSVVPSPSTTP